MSEKPLESTTEIWQIANLTGDTHPIHLDLVQFQLLSRQLFNVPAYTRIDSFVNPLVPAPRPMRVRPLP